jgi:hypothetical protein
MPPAHLANFLFNAPGSGAEEGGNGGRRAWEEGAEGRRRGEVIYGWGAAGRSLVGE